MLGLPKKLRYFLLMAIFRVGGGYSVVALSPVVADAGCGGSDHPVGGHDTTVAVHRRILGNGGVTQQTARRSR